MTDEDFEHHLDGRVDDYEPLPRERIPDFYTKSEDAEGLLSLLEEGQLYGRRWATIDAPAGKYTPDSGETFSSEDMAREMFEIGWPDTQFWPIAKLIPKLQAIVNQTPEQMQQAVNFYELKTRLADLGYNAPEVTDQLRAIIINEDYHHAILHTRQGGVKFEIELERNGKGDFELLFNMANNETHTQYFAPDVPAAEVIKTINQNTMNDQNLSYIQKNLLNLGFGEKLNEDLEKQMRAGTPEFKLKATQEYNGQNVDYTLHFKAGDDRYFFNKYDASLQGKDAEQTIYLNKGYGYSAKEAYNLLAGRSVYKQFTNLENEKYHLWAKINFNELNEKGNNHKLDTFSEGWNYKLERGIDKIDLVGMDSAQERENLFKSLEKGNRHEVTARKDGEEVKILLEANPADHRVNVYSAKGVPQKLETYKKPELKIGKANEQTQQAKEDLPGKKSRKQGVKQHV